MMTSAEKEPNIFSLVISQFKDTTVLGLFLSVIIGLILGAIEDSRDDKISAFIEPFFALALLIINAVISIFFELRRRRVRKLGISNHKRNIIIVENGKEIEKPIEKLSEGDEIKLTRADISPADIQITQILSNSIEYEVKSKDQPLSFEISDKTDGTICQGALIVKGTLYGKVVKTNNDALQLKESKNTFTSQIDSFSNFASIVFLICLVIILLFSRSPNNKSRLKAFLLLTRVPIALLIAGYPDHLSLYSKIAPIAAQKMYNSNAILKDDSAIDTLGRMTVLCGNLSSAFTSNVATVKEFTTISDDIVDVFTVTGDNYSPQGKIQQCKAAVDTKQHKSFEMIASASMLSSDLTIALHTEKNGKQQLVANGSELINAALQAFAVKLVPEMVPPQEPTETKEFNPKQLSAEKQLSILQSVWKTLNDKYHASIVEEFSRKRKCSIIQCGDYKMTVGQNSTVFSQCQSYLDDATGNVVKMSKQVRSKLDYKFRLWSNDYRVLGISFEDQQGNHVWIAGVAIYNQLRDDAMSAVEELKGAGIRVILVSGESLDTVSGYAYKMRMFPEQSDNSIKSVNRQQWLQFDEKQKNDAAREVNLYVEFTEEEKIELIAILRQQKERVGMISGAVSDICAMHLADIGISTIGSSDEIKSVSSVILNNDSDSALSQAVLYSRSAFKTTISSIRFSLSSCISIVLVCLFTSVLRMPVLLSSKSILLISVLTSLFTSIISMNVNNRSQSRISPNELKKQSSNAISFKTKVRILICGIMGAFVAILGALFIFLVDDPSVKYRLQFSDLINIQGHTNPMLEDKAAPTMTTLIILFVYIFNEYDALSDNRMYSYKRRFKTFLYIILIITTFALITQLNVFRGIFSYTRLSVRRWLIALGISLIHAFTNFMLKVIFK